MEAAAAAAAATATGDACKKWKATIVFFSMDAIGHINPQLSIIRELRRRQYRAILLTTRPLGIADKLQKSGFETDYCFEDDSNETNKVVKDVVASQEMFRKGLPHSFEATYSRDGVVGKYLDDMKRTHPKVCEKLKALKADLIVCDHVIACPCVPSSAPKWVRFHSSFPVLLYSLYNERLVPGIGLSVSEMTPEKREYVKRIKSPVREAIREYVREVGAEDWPLDDDLAPTSPWLNLYLGVKEVGFEMIDYVKPPPACWLNLEHTVDDDDDEAEGYESTSKFKVPENLAGLPGKLIYVSFGTIVSGDTAMLNRLLEILSKSPHRFIVSLGQGHASTRLFANQWGEQFVDQKALLPHVDLFITHGGHNSIIEAFYYGVPGLIVCPVFADQFDSAQRVEDCGFGIRLNPFNCTQEQLLGAIERLGSDERLGQRMKQIGERLRSVRYHRVAADRLESLLQTTS